MQYETIFFDLDGTLCDSKPGITRSVSYALKQFGIVADPDDLTMFIGPPLRESFQKYFGFTEENVENAIDRFRERYSTKGIHEQSLYPGIAAMLADLQAAGKQLALATSKSEEFALQILDNMNIAPYFAFAGGADRATRRLTKSAVLRHVRALAGISADAPCLMVGDREHDVIGAHDAGMPCAAVLYGYGSRGELEAAGADFILPTVAELRAWLLG